MIRLIFLLLMSIGIVSAGLPLPPVKTYKTINECQSDIYFGNGIMTTFSEADNALYTTLMPAILHEIYKDNKAKMDKMHHFDVAYNYSFKKDLGVVGGVLDLAETYEQLKNTSVGWESIQYIIDAINLLALEKRPWGEVAKKELKDYLISKGVPDALSTFCSVQLSKNDFGKLKELGKYFKGEYLNNVHDRDLERMVKQYKESVKAGHGVIIISHSQGNLFAIEAVDKLDSWMKNYVYQVSIASPATKFASDKHWSIALDNDPVAHIGTVNEITTNPIRYFQATISQILPDTRTNTQIKWINFPPTNANSPWGFYKNGYQPKKYVKSFSYYDPTLQIKQEYRAKIEADEWKYMQIKFHYFDYYMGKMSINVYYYSNGMIKSVKTFCKTTKSKITNSIQKAIKAHHDNTSQYQIKKEIGCLCKDKYVKMEHTKDANLTKNIQKYHIKNFAGDGAGKIYPVDAKYVRAKCGGVKIEEADEGDVCLVLKDEKLATIGDISGTKMIPKIPGRLFSAQLNWNETAVHMELSNSLMSKNVSDCGMAAAGSDNLTLYDVYPGTYGVNAVNVDGYQDLDNNLSDEVTLRVHAVSANKLDSFTVTNKYQYSNLGKGGHIADIVITRPDPTKPPIPVVVLSNAARYGGGDGGGGRWILNTSGGSVGGSSNSISVVQNNFSLCQPEKSCGCLPCKYNILTYLSQTRLGPISGAKVTLYKATEADKADREILYEGMTSVSNKIDEAGIISLPVPYPQQPKSEYSDEQKVFLSKIAEYEGDFILEVSGGFDIDANDDLNVDSRFREVNSKLHLILSKENLMQNDYKVNILTEIGYQLSEDLLGEHYDKARLQERLNDIAKHVLIEKLYPDVNAPIGRDDLMWWIPAAHKKWLIKPYESTLAPIVEKIYEGESIHDDSYHYVYDKANSTTVPLLESQWFKVDENATGGTLIGSIAVTSEGNSSVERFTLEGFGSKLFHIDSEKKVYLDENATLDYETTPLYQLRLKAYNQAGTSRPVTLYITLNNIPDVPEDKGFEGGVVSENAQVSTVAGHILFDQAGAPIDSMEVTGTDAQSFVVDTNGTILISADADLDYERAPAAHITVRAHNVYGYSKSIPITIIITDAVDIPIIGFADVKLDENATVGTVVANVNIQSNDPIMDVNLSGYGAENFTIDLNGTVRVAPDARLDYESRANYVLSVSATNIQGVSHPNALIIRLNNVPDVPELKHSEFHILEQAPADTYVGSVVVETNGSTPIEVYRLSGEGSEAFRIDDDGKIYTIIIMPNHDKKEFYNLYVEAKNSEGYGPKKIQVIYVDTRRPIIGILDTWVYENTAAGTTIGQIPVVRNGEGIIGFRLFGDGAENFEINKNGVVKVANGANLDYETKRSYALHVAVRNSFGESEPRPLYVRVIDRDDTLVIRGFSTTIHEDLPIGSILGFISLVRNGGKEVDRYELEGEGKENFSIDRSGLVRITLSNFNDKIKKSYHLGVQAVAPDGSRSNKVWIDIYIDDSLRGHPILSSININIEENATAGSTIGHINVIDSGSSPVVRYELSGSGRFSIDSNGNVILNQVLDYETQPHQYTLNVIAYNEKTSSEPTSITINVVNIPDTPPTLQPANYQIEENIPVGTVIGRIYLLSQGEGNITGFTLNGINMEDFTIDRNGTLKTAQEIDYERQHSYVLFVEANSTTGVSDAILLTIEVLNVAETAPVLNDMNFSITEDSVIGSELGQVTMVNSGDTPIISYELNGTDLFAVDDKGIVTLLQDINWSQVQSVDFNVTATNDYGVSEPSVVHVDILRVNYVGSDNSNTFNGTQRDEYFDAKEGDDIIYAGAGNDRLIGGTGNDYLNGGNGDDIYIYYRGDGNDTIEDSAGDDILYLHNITKNETGYILDDTDLVLKFDDNTTIRIVDWVDDNYKIERFVFEDGEVESNIFDKPVVKADASIADLSKLDNANAAQVVQGMIVALGDGDLKVDHWIFNFEGGELIIDTLSELNSNGQAYIDIDGDGKQLGIDLYIYVFKKDANGNWQYIALDDDSSQTYSDGSTHQYDSYLKLNLDAGEYLLAIGNYYLASSAALNGANNAGSYGGRRSISDHI